MTRIMKVPTCMKSYFSHFKYFNVNYIGHARLTKMISYDNNIWILNQTTEKARTCNLYLWHSYTCGKRKHVINTRTPTTTIILMTFVSIRCHGTQVRTANDEFCVSFVLDSNGLYFSWGLTRAGDTWNRFETVRAVRNRKKKHNSYTWRASSTVTGRTNSCVLIHENEHRSWSKSLFSTFGFCFKLFGYLHIK